MIEQRSEFTLLESRWCAGSELVVPLWMREPSYTRWTQARCPICDRLMMVRRDKRLQRHRVKRR